MLWGYISAAFAQAPSISVQGELSYFFSVAAGQTSENILQLTNHGSTAGTARIYQQDYRFTADGQVFYLDANSLPRSNAGWISFSQDEVTVPAGQVVAVPYTVTVPNEADLQDTYWSLIIVEPVVADVSTTSAGGADTTTVGIRSISRTAVQIVTSIGNSGQPQLEFFNPTVTQNGSGSPVFQVDVGNAGTRLIRPSFHLELVNESGINVGRVEGGRGRLYPDTSIRRQFELGDLNPGTYFAVVVADGGNDDIFGIRYTLNITAP